MLQLRHGKDFPQVRLRGTLEALRALRGAAALPGEDVDALREHYLFLRRLEARMRLERDRPVEALGTDAVVLRPLARRMGFDGADPGADLLRAYQRTREAVRALYERHFARTRVDV